MTPPGPAFQDCTGSCHENVPAPKAVSSNTSPNKEVIKKTIYILQVFLAFWAMAYVTADPKAEAKAEAEAEASALLSNYYGAHHPSVYQYVTGYDQQYQQYLQYYQARQAGYYNPYIPFQNPYAAYNPYAYPNYYYPGYPTQGKSRKRRNMWSDDFRRFSNPLPTMSDNFYYVTSDFFWSFWTPFDL